MKVTPETLALIARRPVNDNMRSMIAGLAARPQSLKKPLRLAAFLGQCCHEAGCWQYDREIWGKHATPAQDRYDTRTDLGNTPARDGDGYLYRGRTGLQLTGKDAYLAFTRWCGLNIAPGAPDFVETPDLALIDPWEGLGPIFVWEWKQLDDEADRADTRAITRKINGGYNGLAERIIFTDRAMVILADAVDLKVWQHMKGLEPDGVIGPLTRGALAMALRARPDVEFIA